MLAEDGSVALSGLGYVGGGYDAVKDTGRRASPKNTLLAADMHLRRDEREKLLATTRDARRNITTAAWMIRRHLDYVASFKFQAKTDDEGFNRDLEEYVRIASKPDQFDVAGRHDRAAYLRLMESSAVVDGDVWTLKRNNRRVQAIEGERVCIPPGTRLPNGSDYRDYVHGVKVNRDGRVTEVAVCDRHGRRLVFRTTLPAQYFWQHGYFDRFDQFRGVSPLASALNELRDTHEAKDLALAKAKVEQLFALAIFRDAVDALDASDEDDENTDYSAAVNFGEGPQLLDLDPGDRAEFLKSEAPGSQFSDFIDFVVRVALKSLDIPYSFFDSSAVNFYGGRSDVMQYVLACKPKRERLRNWLDSWTIWNIAGGIRDGVFDLGRKSIGELKWNWQPPAIPIWDAAKEFRGLGMGVAMGTFNLEDLAGEYGEGDVYDNIAANARVMAAASKAGVPIILPDRTAFNPEPAAAEEGGSGNA